MRFLFLAALLAVGVPPARGADSSASDTLAADVTAQVAPLIDAGADVAVAVQAPAGGERLAQALRALVAKRLARAGAARVEAFAGDATAARKKGFEQWVELDVAVHGGHVVVVVNVRRTAFSLWRFITSLMPGGAGSPTAAITAKLDGDLRALLEPEVKRKPRRLAFRQQDDAIDLGAPLLALAAGDLDGDQAAELVALTTTEVVVLRVGPDETTVVKSFALGGEAAVRPRDPVGSLLVADVDGDGAVEILARSSETGAGVILGWKDGALVREADVANHPMCALADEAGGVHVVAAILADGVNWFPREGLFVAPEWKGFLLPALPERFLAMRCAAGTAGVVDGDGKLRLYTVGTRDATATLENVGAAFELADLDGDGAAEIVTSAWRAPGDGDALTILSPAGKALHKGSALRGGVAAIAAGDFNGDGAVDVAAFVRLVDATRGDVWVVQ